MTEVIGGRPVSPPGRRWISGSRASTRPSAGGPIDRGRARPSTIESLPQRNWRTRHLDGRDRAHVESATAPNRSHTLPAREQESPRDCPRDLLPYRRSRPTAHRRSGEQHPLRNESPGVHGHRAPVPAPDPPKFPAPRTNPVPGRPVHAAHPPGSPGIRRARRRSGRTGPDTYRKTDATRNFGGPR